jgi:hypothetical protein
MSDMASCGLLIVAYARANNVQKIVNVAISSSISRIYIALDVSESDSEVQNQQVEIEKLILEMNKTLSVSIKILKRSSNIGCSANLLSGIDWAFNFEDYLAIVEDDCLPTQDFFYFVAEARSQLKIHSKIWIVGGTRIAASVTNNQSVLSRYPITWGWATTKENWVEIRAALISGEQSHSSFRISNLTFRECQYWRSGARRSYRGIIDAWDIPLALAFLQNSRYCLLPPESLVENVGDDLFAMHTNNQSSGIRLRTGFWDKSPIKANHSVEYDSWLRTTHFKIRFRHLLTNNIRRFLDLILIRFRKKRLEPLLQRWQNSAT